MECFRITFFHRVENHWITLMYHGSLEEIENFFNRCDDIFLKTIEVVY